MFGDFAHWGEGVIPGDNKNDITKVTCISRVIHYQYVSKFDVFYHYLIPRFMNIYQEKENCKAWFSLLYGLKIH